MITRDVLRREIVPGARDQIGNGRGHLIRHAHAAQLQDDRCLRRPLAFGEERIVRKHQVHAHLFYAVHGLDRALEFRFERALVVHLFGKVAAGPIRLVEKLKAHSPAASGPCEAASSRALSSSLGRNQHGRAVTRKLVIDILRGQILCELLGVTRAQVRCRAACSRCCQSATQIPTP